MQGDPKVIDYLNKGLRSELTAISQYWLHYRLLNNWGLLNMAKVWRKESIEEMEHADKFTDRILFLDGFPNLQVLDPLRIGQNVKEIIDCDLASEIAARTLYQEAATYCHGVKDYVTRDLFEQLMKDEEHHIDFLETQLDLIKRIGLELYTQKHVGGLGERALSGVLRHRRVMAVSSSALVRNCAPGLTRSIHVFASASDSRFKATCDTRVKAPDFDGV